MTSPIASVIVPLHGGSDIVGACLQSIPPNVEIIVVDDASPDDAAEFVESNFPQATVIRNEANLGFAATANRGLGVASGEILIVLNSDALIADGALERLLEAFEDPRVGIAGPRLVFPDGTHQVSAASFPTIGSLAMGSFVLNELFQRIAPTRRFPWELGLSRRDHQQSKNVDWVQGACLAIRRECFTSIRGFDAGYRMYVEECDLAWRARQAGWTVRYVADATVVHIGGASGSGDPARQARANLEGEARFITRAYGTGRLGLWRWARLASSAVKALLLCLPALLDSRLRNRLRWHAAAVSYLMRRRPRARTS